MSDSSHTPNPADGATDVERSSPWPAAAAPALDPVSAAVPGTPSAPATHWERQALEKLLLSTLEEQKRARRWKYAFRLIWLLVFVGFMWMLLSNTSKPTASVSTAHTAMVTIRGEIDSEAEASAEKIIPALQSAMEDEKAQALVLLINSPGGSPVQAGLIHDEVVRLKALHKKPVYAVVEESCTSAAYYIAVSADRIYADKASLVGSIGVLVNGFGFTELMKKLGIERRLMTAGENKGFMDPFSPMSDAQKQHTQQMLKQIHDQFIHVVKTGRGDRLKASDEVFSGLFWTGEQAVSLGLIDGLNSLEGVARDEVKAEDIVDYTQHSNVAERLVKRFGAAVGEGAVRSLQKPEPLR